MIDREKEFQRLIESQAEYFNKVRADGDLPWFEDPVKLAKLKITATDPMEARRELFTRRYAQPTRPTTAQEIAA